MGGLLSQLNKNSYIKNRMHALLNLYEYSEFPIIDELLGRFSVLDDVGRKSTLDFILFQQGEHLDIEREKKLKNIGKATNK